MRIGAGIKKDYFLSKRKIGICIEETGEPTCIFRYFGNKYQVSGIIYIGMEEENEKDFFFSAGGSHRFTAVLCRFTKACGRVDG